MSWTCSFFPLSGVWNSRQSGLWFRTANNLLVKYTYVCVSVSEREKGTTGIVYFFLVHHNFVGNNSFDNLPAILNKLREPHP